MFILLRVNMATGLCAREPVPPSLAGMGGRALVASLVARGLSSDYAPPGGNALVFAPGLLSGTPVLSQSRLALGCISPESGTIRSATAGSLVAEHLIRLGILAVIIEGKAPEGAWQQLEIRHSGAALAASPVAGLGNTAAIACLRKRYARFGSCVTIGPAGEMGLAQANVAFADANGVRHAGQGGMGAVMGAKGLKSIVLLPGDEAITRPIADSAAFDMAEERLAAALSALAGQTGRARRRNDDAGEPEAKETWARKTEKDETLGHATGEGLAGKSDCRNACGLCGPAFSARRKKHGEKSAAFTALWGPANDTASRALRDRFTALCDDMGLDAFSLSAEAMEAVKNGTLPGDGASLIKALESIFALSPPEGHANNTLETLFPLPSGSMPDSGKAASAAALDDEHGTTAFADAVGLCAFAARAVLGSAQARTAMTELLNAAYGWTLANDYPQTLGHRILDMEMACNERLARSPQPEKG